MKTLCELKVGDFLYAYDHGKVRKREILSVEDKGKWYEVQCRRCKPYHINKHCLEYYDCFWANSQTIFPSKEAFEKWLNNVHRSHKRLYSRYANLSYRYWSALKHVEEAMEALK